MPVPEGWCKSSADHAPSLSNGHVHRRTGSPDNVSPEPHSRAVGASRTFRVARDSHRHRRPGSGHPDERVAVAQERVSKLEAALRAVGDDDDTAPNNLLRCHLVANMVR